MELTSEGVTLVLLFCLQLTGSSEGKLMFRNPLHDARIYEGAPPGIHVATVQAYEPQSAKKSVMYSLLDVRDHLYFAIDSTSGNISTTKTIERKVGETYEIIAVAISQGETKLRQLQITITEYNEHPPVFEHDVYRGELHIKAKVGSNVLRVRATDADTVPYNAEVFYRLDPDDPKGRFTIDPLNGMLNLARPLDIMPLQPTVEVGVVAVDGGSPPRSDSARIEVLVKTISEPRDVRYTNATGSKVHICWSRPKHGHALGYLIKYREVENPHGSPSFHNVTSNATSHCTTLVDLKAWTDYEFRVYGWNVHETGQGSAVGRFGTRPDYCRMNICKHGECHVLNEEPGYHCDCVLGYYGDVCDKFNPCSLNPCENFGSCRNISSNKYRCDCLGGFSGVNCSEFNSCAIRPSPCLNGARCESTASHKYQCYCIKGYFGKTCQFFDPCSVDPCQNGGRCQNVSQDDYVCKCTPGFAGKQCELDVDECASSPCKHGGVCMDAVNNYHCRCSAGYRGKRCHLVEHCIAQTVQTDKGLFRWNSTAHGRAYLIECPFGSIFPDREGAIGYAKRRCYLLSNGSVAWGRMELTNCREEGFKTAEDLTGELRILTQDPKHLNIARLQEAAKQIENIIEYALYDKKIAHNMLSIISNMLDIDEVILETGDRNGTTSNRITDLVDKFVTEVKLEKGESLSLETENLVVKAHSWDPDTSEFGEEDGLLFSVRYRQQRQRRDQGRSGKHRTIPHHTRWSEHLDEDSEIVDDDTELVVPLEALLMAQNQTYDEVRVKFVSYRNDKFFRTRYSNKMDDCWKYGYRSLDCANGAAYIRFAGRRVLQVSIANATVVNLSEPVSYVMPSPLRYKVYCAYWKETERVWSIEGLLTNQTGNVTTCFSNHMTAFSLLLDPTPHEGISPDHLFALSMISYVGCGLSMLGLSLTILTYSMFKCLNHDHPGQILLHLCSSMLLMNVAFVAGSQKGHALYGVDVCVAVAVLVHYFLLTTLAWMGVEAANMYQLLIHVFASSESRFMLKRAILAWGIPLLIVGVTVLIDWGVYRNQNEYCMLSSANPYVYYISYLGPSCLILLVNLTVFVMVTRVLFTPRNVSKPAAAMQTKEKVTVTAAQVRGAFSVMVLLGVSWVFGAFAVGEARLVFQYLFCVANSLQGFLIFLVRCLQYPEARSAWCQLLKTGTFKKKRGMVPPGSWSGNSNSSHNKQNGHSTTTRLGSADANAVAFNANFWNKGSSKEEERSYDDQQSENGQDFAARSAQLLTFSATLKQDSKDEKRGKRLSFEKGMSKSISGSSDSKQIAPSPGCPSIVEQKATTVTEVCRNDSDGLKSNLLRQCAIVPGEPDVLSIPAEPKSRSSYGSSIGYIDEEAELKEKAQAAALEKKLFAQKAAAAAGHPKESSPPDKQNSWPRTLSSFLGGKDVLKSSLSDTGHHSTMPKRIFSPPGKSPLVECPSERQSPQVIPLQVRPSTPLIHPPAYTPSRNLSFEKEYTDALAMKESAIPDIYSHRESVSPRASSVDAASIPERSWSSIPPSDNHQKTLPTYGQHMAMHPEVLRRPSTDVGTDQLPVSSPIPHVVNPHSADNQTIPQVGEFSDEFGILADEDTFRIWERQGLVSPSKAMFIDSAASRL